MTREPILTERILLFFTSVHIVFSHRSSISAAFFTETPIRSIDSVDAAFAGIRMQESVAVGIEMLVITYFKVHDFQRIDGYYRIQRHKTEPIAALRLVSNGNRRGRH